MHEIIWYGRGGQGVVLGAQILAEAAYLQGYKGVTSVPTFGPERRGAPLTASTRISDEPVRTFSQIEFPDVAIVLDATVLKVFDIPKTLKDGGTIIINTPLSPDEIDIDGHFTIATVDASRISLEQHLIIEEAPIINTLLLGALVRATGLVTLDSIEKGLKKKLPGDKAFSNFLAAKKTFEITVIRK